MHLTVYGGNINITSGNDGINTNEDEVSVTTLNGGSVNILVTGETGEGDGIDSNGWLVINGGTLTSQASSTSGDAGIDSDMGIHINGGTISATGNMLDRISESKQSYAVFQFMQPQKSGCNYILKNANGDIIAEYAPENDFSYLILSSDKLAEGTYTLWQDNAQLSVADGNMHGGMKGPDGQKPGGMMMPEGHEIAEGEMPKEQPPEKPEGEMPQGKPPVKPEGEMPDKGSLLDFATSASTEFEIKAGGNNFIVISAAE